MSYLSCKRWVLRPTPTRLEQRTHRKFCKLIWTRRITQNNSLELTDPDSTFYFLIQDGQLAGYLKLNVNDGQSEPMGPDYLEVERIYLKPSFQHLGLGKTMITFAEKQAIQAHKSKVWLGVWEHNENAKAFYHRLGFEKVGAHTFYMGDDPQTDFMMSKTLTED